jgi:autophagy-related protein 9
MTSRHLQFSAETPSSSRPFLNLLNPLGRAYQGYSQANQSLVEEEDENRYTEEDMEAGQVHGQSNVFPSSKSHRKRQVSWDAPASQMNILRPNIHQEDRIHENESSDDEVPQSFMIEATSHKLAKGKVLPSNNNWRQPLNSSSGKRVPPIGIDKHRVLPPSLPIPPRPSEVDGEEVVAPKVSRDSSEPSDQERQPKQMRGLDAYERALWNWVNVYNLDAFLQEVYQYYEGKGIYSIALARGLNLLSVICSSVYEVTE